MLTSHHRRRVHSHLASRPAVAEVELARARRREDEGGRADRVMVGPAEKVRAVAAPRRML